MTWRTLPFHIRARIMLWLATCDIARSRRLDTLSAAAVDRAAIRMGRARALVERIAGIRQAGPSYPAGDLLYGSKAIAAHLGVPKGVAVHLVRSGSIPWFKLARVVCARRSTLAAHFAKSEVSPEA